MKKYIYLFFISFCICCGKTEVRKPVSVRSNTFLKESAQKNKQLLAYQSSLIDSVIGNDSIHKFITSKDGFKYYYITENTTDTIHPKFGDVVQFYCDLSDIYGNQIYSDLSKKVKTYYVDKEEMFMGLRNAIKILNAGEEAVFFFPSEIAFGYHGDENKIGSNKPIKAQVKLLNISKDTTSTSNDNKLIN